MLTNTVLSIVLLFGGLFVLRFCANKWIQSKESCRLDGAPIDTLDKFDEQERVWMRLKRLEKRLGGKRTCRLQVVGLK